VEHQVQGAEDDGAHEQQEPPARQRVVILLDAIEGVAHGLVGNALGLFALAGCEDQPEQSHQGAEGEQGDVPAPERSHSWLLLAPCWLCMPCGSAAKGSCAASSKLPRRLLLKDQRTTPMKATKTTRVHKP